MLVILTSFLYPANFRLAFFSHFLSFLTYLYGRNPISFLFLMRIIQYTVKTTTFQCLFCFCFIRTCSLYSYIYIITFLCFYILLARGWPARGETCSRLNKSGKQVVTLLCLLCIGLFAFFHLSFFTLWCCLYILLHLAFYLFILFTILYVILSDFFSRL